METFPFFCALGLLGSSFAAQADLPGQADIHLKGLHAYAGGESVAAGEEITFHVSSEYPYRFRVSKLGRMVDDRSSDETIFSSPEVFEPGAQPIRPGSWIRVAKSLPSKAKLETLTLECWVRPWSLNRWQGIITQHDYPDHCGYGLFLDGSGRVVFLLGTGGAFEPEAQVVGPKLNVRQWFHLAATWDGERAVLWVDGKTAGEWRIPEGAKPRSAGPASLRLGAYGAKGLASNTLDGDIAMPAIYGTALDAKAIAARVTTEGLTAPTEKSLLAFWPLSEERGRKVADATGHGFNGEIVNLGTWMIGGPSFDGTKVNRYDASYDPAKDPTRGHALRLASDDLYDCGWEARHTWRVPEGARSGIYAAWFEFKKEGVELHYPVTFIVKKAKKAKKAPIALMCSTTTWRAYNGTPFAQNVPDENRFWETGGAPNDPANPPAYNFYRDHAAGQPTYQVGLRIPWPTAGPDVLYSDKKVGYSHLMRGERFTHVWLEKQGYEFDVITNLDLHRDPDLLQGYRTLIINGHDEYWSRRMYEGLDRYLKSGGSTAVLSGNTMFWRISVDDELGVIECRKYGPNIGGRRFANVGEIYHSADGRRGSLMRNCGLPPAQAIGLECSGWWAGSNNGVYRATAPNHTLFQNPEKIDFSDRKIFGGAKSGPRKAGGHEGDIRLSSFAPHENVPKGAAVPDEPVGIETIANIVRKNARVLDYFANFGAQKEATLVDMIYWERPEGGKVFNAGAIAFGWALDADPIHSKLLRNVLFHLAGVKAKTPYDPVWLDPEGDRAKAKRVIAPEKDQALILRAADAALAGDSVKVNPDHGALAWWKSSKDVARWKVRGAKKGHYTVVIDYAVPDNLAGQAFVVKAGQATLTTKAESTGGWAKWARKAVGKIVLEEADFEVSLAPSQDVNGDDLLDLRALELIPMGSSRLKKLESAAEETPTISTFTVPEGFVVEAVALPPLVSHPMMACLDDRGRMFISESAGKNAKAPELLRTRPHKILMLEDTNHDGVFDKSTVFAENLVLPNGAQWHDGALYVCSPPYVWKFEDTDGDGKADQQTPVGGKFGFNGMSSAFHGPVLGPDGRMYYCGGQHGWTLGDTSPGLNFAGPWVSRAPGVFSMWPNGDDPENRAQGGLANPVEVTFSSEGEVFGTVAVYQNLNGRKDALLHWIHGTTYNLSRKGIRPRTSRELLAPMSRRGWVAPPGLCRYRSGEYANGFGPDYRDDIFLTEFNSHRVYRIVPERKGASYVTTDQVFLESTSPYSHFTDVFEDADGSLLVVDTGGWFLYGCPKSAIARPDIKGGIYRIRKKDSKPGDDPRGLRLNWKNPSVAWLDDPRFTVRDRAKAELAKRGEGIVSPLREILKDQETSPRYRRGAIWTLTRIDHPKAREAVVDSLADPSPSVRLTAARSCSVWRDPNAVGRLQILVCNDEPQIRREAATALGRAGAKGDSVRSLLVAVKANTGTDPYLDHSLIYALIEIDDWTVTCRFLEDESPHVRRAALIACVEMESSELRAEQLTPHLASKEPALRAEALRLATTRPEWGGSLVGYLKTSLEAEAVSPALADALVEFSNDAKVQALLADALRRETTRALALEVIGRSELKSTPASWQAALRSQLQTSPDAVLIETIGRLHDEGRLEATAFTVDWLKLASVKALDTATRLAALDLAARVSATPLTDALFGLLVEQFDPAVAVSQRVKAAKILGRVTLNSSQQRTCVNLVSKAGPLEIGSLLGAFRAGADDKTLDLLATALSGSPGLFSLSEKQLDSIFRAHGGARPLIERIRRAASQREERLDGLVATVATKSGDPNRGKVAFAKATCIVCHKAKGEGGILGPDLSTLGAVRSERDLLEAIAFPSATFARGYEPFVVTMKDGSKRLGRLGRETKESLELIDAAGQSSRIPAKQITGREMASVSLMPPGLERLLTPQELADLVAYLKRLK